MKVLLPILIVLGASPSFAEVQVSTSKFHLFNSKCEATNEEGPAMTPQSPPLDVDDPGTPGCNNWEINVLASGDFTKGERQYELPLLDINYGIGDNFQLKYEVPMEKVQSDVATENHVGRSKVGVKYMFFEDEESDTQVGFYPQVDMQTPGTSKDTTTDTTVSGNIVTLPLLFSTKVGHIGTREIALSANLGYNISNIAGTENSAFGAVGLGMPLSKSLAIMGEVSDEEAFSKNADDVRDELVKLNVGLVETISKHFLVYGSVGESLAASDHLNHQYAVAGIRFLADALDK